MGGVLGKVAAMRIETRYRRKLAKVPTWSWGRLECWYFVQAIEKSLLYGRLKTAPFRTILGLNQIIASNLAEKEA
jgi:hypothetical protein